MTTATSGRSSLLPFAYFDPDSSSLRTSQGTFLSDSMSSSLTLPRSGSMRSGGCYQRAPLAHATAASGSSSSLPTPTAWLGRRDAHSKGDPERWTNPARSNELSDFVAHLLPTPAVNDMGEGKTVEAWDTWTEKMRSKHGNGNGHGKSLAIEAARLLPTPTVGDSKSACNSTANRSKEPPTGVHAGDTLTDIARMLPTPTTGDAGSSRTMPRGNLTLKGSIEGTRPSDDSRHGATTSPPSDDTSAPSDDQLRLL